jgi:effector-binding domain-containing protein
MVKTANRPGKTGKSIIRFILLGGWIMLMISLPSEAQGTAKMYPRTPPGVIEIKTIPEARILVTEADGSYFDESNQLFGRLFSYIKAHEIPMTAPVEGSLDEDARMTFYVGPQAGHEELDDQGKVRVLLLPERTVASIGARGSYKEKNVRKYLEKLESWLAEKPDHEVAGPAYSVFWNPPFIPWFLRHFEVHIPIRSSGTRNGE